MIRPIMNTVCLVAVAAGCLLTPTSAWSAGDQQTSSPVIIAIGPKASLAEKIAAEELATHLRKLYPRQSFDVRAEQPESGFCILLGTLKSNPRLSRHVKPVQISASESFLVTATRDGSRNLAVIAGADPLGCVYGVYAILERLGCGFYLSYDALPEPRSEPFSFDGWNLSDRPLAVDRIVFNWHNFISGCTCWNLADWRKWIEQSQKMRFNTIMVHAYGNNPMFTFSFGGKAKPVGYISSTARGRDWANAHVNDVRRLVGGAAFNGPVFGADVALAPDDRHVEATQAMMKQVFDEAANRGMHVSFALDVDTDSSNPQELIETLPESARYRNGKFWFAMPDTPEGYAYYKAQVQSVLTLYPRIDRLVVWVRNGINQMWMLTPATLPARWRDEFQAAVAKDPAVAKMPGAAGWFATGKIVAAYQQALHELSRDDVRLMTGSWCFGWLPTADRFLPSGVPLVALDYHVLKGKSELDTPQRREATRKIASHRPVVPIVWAHHDDGEYRGRCYTPFDGFHTKLVESGVNSFGIIHWTTRPLDLYFRSLSKQVWSATVNQGLSATCREMAEHWFGPAGREAGADYLLAWVTGAPMFSRETSVYFDRPMTPTISAEVAAGVRTRLAMLDRLNAAKVGDAARERIAYWRGMEEFATAFYQAECAYQQGRKALAKGDFKAVRGIAASLNPEAVVEQYASASRRGDANRGEQAGIVSISLRWLPYVISLRQASSLEPVRLKFGPTSHEPLAMYPGRLTFFADADHHLWRVFGANELDVEQFAFPEDVRLKGPADLADVCRTRIETTKPLTLKLLPFMHDKGNSPRALQPGKYRVRVLAADPTSTAAGQRVSEIALVIANDSRPQKTTAIGRQQWDVFKQSGGANHVAEIVFPIEVKLGDCPTLTLTPVKGKALLCAVVLEPSGKESPN